MSTRSRIGVLQEKTGKVKSVYCHSDGYLTGVGQTLLTDFNTYERANAIIALGDLSALHKNLDPLPEAPYAYHFSEGEPEILKTHSFDRPQRDVTIAYHRDRKEKLMRQINSTLEEFYEKANFQAYNYLFKDGKWNVMSESLGRKVWHTLTEHAIQKEEERIAEYRKEKKQEIATLRQNKSLSAPGKKTNLER
ncbi:MAG TPA: hypothetical protein VK809_09165 [Bacteroidia bacterium]|jgi:hypothetical protein|nr:hypothetical protein [Bacteroidia bacterium]